MNRWTSAVALALTVTFAAIAPPAQAQVLIEYTYLDASVGWQNGPPYTPEWTSCYNWSPVCNFYISTGYLDYGTKQLVIKPNSYFPKNKKIRFEVVAEKYDAGFNLVWWELLATYTLTKSGGTYTIPNRLYTYPAGVRIHVDFYPEWPFNILDNLDYIQLKKYL